MSTADSLVERYVALWNDPDPDNRRKLIEDLWADDGRHVLEPPQEMVATAHGIGMGAPHLEIQGHDALERRVTHAYEQFVAPGQHHFRSRGNVSRIGDLVKFNWEMVETNGGAIAGVGLDIFLLDPDGRITVQYQFVES